jgi:flagellin
MHTDLNPTNYSALYNVIEYEHYINLIKKIYASYSGLFTIEQLIQLFAINAVLSYADIYDVNSFNQQYQQVCKLLYAGMSHVSSVNINALSSEQYATCFANHADYNELLLRLKDYFLNVDVEELSIVPLMSSIINGSNADPRTYNKKTLYQLATDALHEITAKLDVVIELAEKSANGSNAATDRQALQAELVSCVKKIEDIKKGIRINYTPNEQNGVGASTDELGLHSLTLDEGKNALQNNHYIYYESNGGLRVVKKDDNPVQVSSTIILTPSVASDVAREPTVITSYRATAAEIAAQINDTSLAHASAFTQVSFSGFTIDGNAKILITIDQNANSSIFACLIDAEMIKGTDQEVYSRVATALNANEFVQEAGCYAIASNTAVTMISRHGYDITALSSIGASIEKVQLFNNYGLALGAPLTLVGEVSICAHGGVGLKTKPNVTVTFEGIEINAVERAAQPTNLNPAHELVIYGPLRTAPVKIAEHQAASAIVKEINRCSKISGVSAMASTSVILRKLSASGTISFYLAGNNTAPRYICAFVTTSDLTQLIANINDEQHCTGITATMYDAWDVILLTNADGNDIKITNFNHSAAVTAPENSATYSIIGDE